MIEAKGKDETPGRASRLVVWLPLVALTVLIASGFLGFSYDDNFITYRYARNWAEGQGLVYNLGEKVLGTSAPGYAILLGSLSRLTRRLGLEIPDLGTLISLLSLLATAGILHAFVLGSGHRRAANRTILGFGALAMTSKFNLWHLGSEAFPVMAAVTGAAYLLLVTRRPVLAGGLVGFAMFLRLDAGLAALLMGLVVWYQSRRFPTAFAATGLLILSVWLVFLGSYFGDLIPNTLAGKTALREVPYTFRQWQTLNAALPLGSCLFLLAGALGGLVELLRKGWWRQPIVLALGSWLLANEITYRAIGVWFASWYHLALFHAILALFVLAACRISEGASTAVAKKSPGLRRATSGLVLVALLTPILLPGIDNVVDTWRQPPDTSFRAYSAIGRHLRQEVGEDCELLAMEIGVLGYISRCRVLDLGALVSPQFTVAKFSGSRADLVVSLAPELIVLARQDAILSDALARPGFRQRYREMKSFKDDGIGPVTVFRKRGPGE